MDPLLMLLQKLNEQGVDYVLVGGMAAIAHGARVVTEDVDVCASMSSENKQRIVRAMEGLHAKWSRRPGPPLWLESVLERLEEMRNIYLDTDLGVIDFLGELPGVGDFQYAKANSHVVTIAPGFKCNLLSIDALLACKRAANRPKDQQSIRILEAIRNESSLFHRPEGRDRDEPGD